MRCEVGDVVEDISHQLADLKADPALRKEREVVLAAVAQNGRASPPPRDVDVPAP